MIRLDKIMNKLILEFLKKVKSRNKAKSLHCIAMTLHNNCYE